jgi:preprotein translocase subunit YajC
MSGDFVSTINAVWPFILMAAIFYFMLWRPQKKEQNRRQKMLNALKKGDKVVTIGGIHGVLTAVGEKKITLQIAEGVEIDMNRSAVSGFLDATKQQIAENAK